MLNYTINSAGSRSVMTLFLSDVSTQLHTVDNDHPRFEEIRDAVLNNHNEPVDEAAVLDLIEDLSAPITAAIQQIIDLSPAMQLDPNTGSLTYHDEEINGVIVRHILQAIDDDEVNNKRVTALVRFLENLHDNPSYSVHEQLYAWLDQEGLTIDEDGNIIGYKGLTTESTSRFTGTAWVDGIKVEGRIPNYAGSTVTMPRRMVNDDADNSCAQGLHVGTSAFAYNFAGSDDAHVATVSLSPADVVAIPYADVHKMRVSEYHVLDVVRREDFVHAGINALLASGSFEVEEINLIDVDDEFSLIDDDSPDLDEHGVTVLIAEDSRDMDDYGEDHPDL